MAFYDDMDTSHMDSEDWSGIDVSGPQDSTQLEAPDMSGWDSSMWQQPQQPSGWEYGPGNSEQWNNIGGTPVLGTGQDLGGFMQNGAFQRYTDLPNFQSSLQQNLGGVQNTLANLFNNKGFVSGIGALMEGSQNKKKAAMTQQMVRQMQPAMDPFGAQRGQYQQELARTMQDPYSAPIVRDQVEQLKRAQAIKDAAAGRRSNSATTDPALMAAMAGVAQKYMDSLYTPAGANINPSGLSSLISAMQQGNNADIHGYISPLLSAAGYKAGNETTNADIQAIKEKLGMK